MPMGKKFASALCWRSTTIKAIFLPDCYSGTWIAITFHVFSRQFCTFSQHVLARDTWTPFWSKKMKNFPTFRFVRNAALAIGVVTAISLMSQDASAQYSYGHGGHGIHGGHGVHGGYNTGYSANYARYPSYGNSGFSFSINRGYGGYNSGYSGVNRYNSYYAPTRHSSYYGGPRWHDTSHLDYHPGQYVPHGNHVDYIPGHYDVHRTGHWDH